jgi:hypothetical protein
MHAYRHMLEDLKMRAVDTHGLDPRGEQISSLASLRAKQMQVIDLERNILQVGE